MTEVDDLGKTATLHLKISAGRKPVPDLRALEARAGRRHRTRVTIVAAIFVLAAVALIFPLALLNSGSQNSVTIVGNPSSSTTTVAPNPGVTYPATRVATDPQGCPLATPLPLTKDADAQAAAIVADDLQSGGNQFGGPYQIQNVYKATPPPSPEAQPHAAIPYTQCDPGVGADTIIVEVYLPKALPSASLSQLAFFVSRFREGWRIWFIYQ